MKILVLFQFVLIILLFGLVGCGTSNNADGNSKANGEMNQGEENLSENLKISEETNIKGDFKVSIYVEDGEKDLNVYATITYIGEEDKLDIYHGGSIFFFNIYEIDGEFEHIGGMNQPLLTTTLTKEEAHRIKFNNPVLDTLEPGKYEFEAVADFSLDADDVLGTTIEIPVSVIVKIN